MADPSLGAVGAGSDAGPHFVWAKHFVFLSGTYSALARLSSRAAATVLPERAKGAFIVLGPAALILATMAAGAAPAPAPTLNSASPWWEKITFRISDDGEQQSCRYESSRSGIESCENASEPAALHEASNPLTALTSITVERRFSPGNDPGSLIIDSGDTLLGARMMSVAIDGDGAVRSCETVGTLGEMRAGYGCEELRAERFEASAHGEPRTAFLTVLVYGHEEQLT